MTCGQHESDLAVLHRTYVRLGEEADDDLLVICRQCASERYGLVVTTGGDGGVIATWDRTQYPYDGAARPGHPCYRPGPDWPPSLNEVEHRLRVGAVPSPR